MGVLEDYRRAAAAAVADASSPSWAFGGGPAVVAFLSWGGQSYVTPLVSRIAADAYFSHADQIGIDYDYGAYFDVANVAQPTLIWERLGRASLVSGSSSIHRHAPGDHAMTHHPLVGRHGGHGGRGGGRRFFGGGGGWWPYGWPYYYAAWPGYGSYSEESEEEDVVSGRGGRGGGGGYHRRRRSRDDGDGQQAPYGGGPLAQPELRDGDESDDVVGAERRAQIAAAPGNELLALLPALAPGAGGICCRMHLGSDMQLRVRICVDGHCYQLSADLSDVLKDVARGVVAAHDRLHGRVDDNDTTAPPAAASPDALASMSSDAQQAVETAGRLLVGALYDQHVRTMTGGFWSGLRSVYETVSTPVTWFNKGVAKVLQQPGIKQAVTAAATAVATAYGGPAAGAAAAKFTGPIIDSSAETGGDPLKLFDDAKKKAGNDPQVHQALDHASTAIAQTTAAYHLGATAADAAGGDPVASQKIAQVDQAAGRGDPAAVQAMNIIQQIFAQVGRNQAGAGGPNGGPPPGWQPPLSRADLPGIMEYPGDPGYGAPPAAYGPPPGAYPQDPYGAPPPASPADPMPPEVTGASIDAMKWRHGSSAEDRALRAEGSTAAVALYQQTGQPYIGFVKVSGSASTVASTGHVVAVEDTTLLQSFTSGDQADDWLGAVDQQGYGSILYAAYYDATDPTWPRPVNELFGARAVAQTVSQGLGILPWLAFGAAAGGGYAWWRHHQAARVARAAAAAETAARAAQIHDDHAAAALANDAHMPPGAAPTTSGGVLLPLVLAATAGAFGGAWWGRRHPRHHGVPVGPPPTNAGRAYGLW